MPRPTALLILALLLPFAALLQACAEDDGDGIPTDRFEIRFTSVAPESGGAPLDVRFNVLVTPKPGRDAPDNVAIQWNFGDGSSFSDGGTEQTHRFETPGTFAVAVTADQIAGGRVIARARAETTVQVFVPPDYVPVALSLSRLNLLSGDTFDATFRVTNRGASDPGGAVAGIWAVRNDLASPTTPPDAARLAAWTAAGQAWKLAESTLDAIPAGASIDRTLTGLALPDSVPTGSLAVLVYVDPDEIINEAIESNNVQFAAQPVAWTNLGSSGPDLFIRNLQARPSRVNRLERITLQFELVNGGNQGAVLFGYRVWLSPGNTTIDDGDALLVDGRIENLPEGRNRAFDAVELALDPAIDDIGEYWVVVEVDPGREVRELNEDNNLAFSSPIVVTSDPVAGADLIVSSLQVAPTRTFLGGTIQLTATVTNQGTDATGRRFLCRAYLEPDDALDPASAEVLASFPVEALDAGQSATVDEIVEIPDFVPSGDAWLFLLCDAGQAVVEADEFNNFRRSPEKLRIAEIAAVNLAINDFTLSPTTVFDGAPVRVDVEICNTGTDGAGPTILRVFLSEDAVVDRLDRILLQSRVPGIEPGACITVGASVPASCNTFVSTYNVFAVADATAAIVETDLTDNLRALGQLVTFDDPICNCVPDPFEPNNVAAQATLLDPDRERFLNLSMCDTAVDWYTVPLRTGETLRAVANFANARGNLDLYLYNADGVTELARSITDGDAEELVFFVAPRRADYLLKVQGRTPTDWNLYDLTLSVSGRQPGTDLTVVNVRSAVPSAVLGQTISVSFDVLNLGTEPAGPSRARLFLSDDAVIDPATDLQLSDLPIDGVIDRVSRSVSVTLPIDDPGGPRYLGVIVDAAREIDETSELNNIGVSPPFTLDASCWDPFEPNNRREEARTLPLADGETARFTGLLACSDNRDFYRVCARANGFLRASASFSSAAGDLDLRLTDELGRTIAVSESSGPTEEIFLEYLPADRCFLLEAWVVGPGREVPYTLDIATGRADIEFQCNQTAEPNDDPVNPIELRDFLDANLAVCPVNDEDWYAIQLARNTDLRLSFAPADGETGVLDSLTLTLYRRVGASNTYIANTTRGSEALDYLVPVDGRYVIRVRSTGDGPRSQPYRLVLGGVAGVDLTVRDLVLDPSVSEAGGRVRYSIEVGNARDESAPATELALWLSSDPLLDATDTLLRRDAVSPLAPFATRTTGGKLDIPASLLAGGDHWVIARIDDRATIPEFNERNNTVAVPLRVLASCIGDDAEPNDFPGDAARLLDHLDRPLGLCAEDVDWFELDVPFASALTLNACFAHDDGDLDLFAWDPANLATPIARSDSVTDNESITLAAGPARRVLIEVTAFDTRVNAPYTLSLAPCP